MAFDVLAFEFEGGRCLVVTLEEDRLNDLGIPVLLVGHPVTLSIAEEALLR